MFQISLSTEAKFIRPKLLFGSRIPRQLHGVNPRSIMGKVWWDKTRREAYDKNNDCCWACGVHRSEARPQRWLEAHEVYDINWKKGRMKLKEVVALCPLCHNFIHRGRLEALVDKRKVQPKFLNRVVGHGISVLVEYNLYEKYVRAKEKEDEAVRNGQQKWHKWYLLLDGKKYYSKFKSAAEWEEYYSRIDARRGSRK